MELTKFQKDELEHYLGIAETEAETEAEEGGDAGEWQLTAEGYRCLLRGERLVREDLREVMREELGNHEDNYSDEELYEWRLVMSHALGTRRPPAARPVEVVRDLGNPEYTIPYGKNRYCGPAALAYLLRTDPDAAAYLLRKASGKRSIRGTFNGYMMAVLREHGFTPQPLPAPPARHCAPTLRRWLEDVQPQMRDTEYLVTITGHYIVVHGERWFDNRCHQGKPHTKSPYLRRRVQRAWIVA